MFIIKYSQFKSIYESRQGRSKKSNIILDLYTKFFLILRRQPTYKIIPYTNLLLSRLCIKQMKTSLFLKTNEKTNFFFKKNIYK